MSVFFLFLCKMPSSIPERITLTEAFIHLQSYEETRKLFIENFPLARNSMKSRVDDLV